MSFQSLESLLLPSKPFSLTSLARRLLSSSLQLLVAKLTFFKLSHLNMQDSAVTPGIREATTSQSWSSWVIIVFTNYFSTSMKLCLSAYLEITQIRIWTSYSLQFFLMRLFLIILDRTNGTYQCEDWWSWGWSHRSWMLSICVPFVNFANSAQGYLLESQYVLVHLKYWQTRRSVPWRRTESGSVRVGF